MAFFFGLLSLTILIWGLSLLFRIAPYRHFWNSARIAAVVMFVSVGISHLVDPEGFIYMIEAFAPFPKMLVILSGLTEILLALGLLWVKTRKIAAGLLMIQLILMFPANINVAINDLSPPGNLPSEPWYIWSRLFFQPLYIYWVYKAAFKPQNILWEGASFVPFLRLKDQKEKVSSGSRA